MVQKDIVTATARYFVHSLGLNLAQTISTQIHQLSSEVCRDTADMPNDRNGERP